MLARYRTRQLGSKYWSKNSYIWIVPNKYKFIKPDTYLKLFSYQQKTRKALHNYTKLYTHLDGIDYCIELVGVGSLKAAITYNAKRLATVLNDKCHNDLHKKQAHLWKLLDIWYQDQTFI